MDPSTHSDEKLDFKPVNAKIFRDEEKPAHLGKELYEKEREFRMFADRMLQIKKIYLIRGKKETRVIKSPDENTINAEENTEWINCCLVDYLERSIRFKKKYSSRTQLIVYVCCALLVFMGFLYVIWPIWDFLIDVEADTHLKVLGLNKSASTTEIKKAYRQKVKEWHPDHNPDCGNECRQMVMRLQQAHDILLSKGDQTLELANRYKNELLQLRSLVYFRMYDIAYNAAREISVVLSRAQHRNSEEPESFTLKTVCIAATMLFFVLYEILFVSGFNLIMFVQIFFFYINNVLKSSAEEARISSQKRIAYVDLVKEALIFVAPVSIVSLLYVLLDATTLNVGEEIFRVLFGALYVLGFLYRLSPNIFDNFRMKKCSLPLWSIRTSDMRFSWLTFISAQLGLLANDLFVFTCRVPPAFRLTAYAVNFVYVSQLLLLPWDAPITVRKGETKEHGKSRGTVESATRVKKEIVPDSVPMKEDEVELVENLDAEAVLWLDITTMKYKTLMLKVTRDFVKKTHRAFQKITLSSTYDVKNVAVCVLTNENGMSKMSVIALLPDEKSSSMIAMEAGPQAMLPEAGSSVPPDPETMIEHYKTIFGSRSLLNISQVYRSRKPTKSTIIGMEKILPIVALAATIVVLVCCAPTKLDFARSTIGLAPHQRFPILDRFEDYLKIATQSRKVDGSTLFFIHSNFIVLTADFWQAIRGTG